MYTVSWKYAQFSSHRDIILSGYQYPGHEPMMHYFGISMTTQLISKWFWLNVFKHSFPELHLWECFQHLLFTRTILNPLAKVPIEWYPFTHNSTDKNLLPNPWIWSTRIGILNSFNDCWVKFALRQDWGTFTKERDITKIIIQISCHWNVSAIATYINIYCRLHKNSIFYAGDFTDRIRWYCKV